MEQKEKSLGRGMGIDIPGSCHGMDFAAFSHMRNWWENPNVSHMF